MGTLQHGSPYYGAYFAAMALANAEHVVPLDDQKTNYAAYVIYRGGKPIRVVLYNSDYYTGGTRSSQTFTITGLPTSSSVSAKRLTAPNANSRQDRGSVPSIAGRSFEDGTCAIRGTEAVEINKVVGGRATFTVFASEALLVQL